eukprot:9422735-Karenia_brevis.AAC.1
MGQRCEALKSNIQVASNLTEMMSKPHPAPQEYFELPNQVQQVGIIVGPAYIQYQVVLRGLHAMMRNNSQELCL